MHQPLRIHALRYSGLSQQVDGTAFQNPRPDAPQHIFRRLPLKNNGFDPGSMQQLSQQQPGGARPDNRDLCFHRIASRSMVNYLFVFCLIKVLSCIFDNPDEKKKAKIRTKNALFNSFKKVWRSSNSISAACGDFLHIV
ncbi:Uncharacterised protein [Raoultella ornithinolytica]|nr:Uncharacterised protein [Raoultella ornithinolytica]